MEKIPEDRIAELQKHSQTIAETIAAAQLPQYQISSELLALSRVALGHPADIDIATLAKNEQTDLLSVCAGARDIAVEQSRLWQS